VRADVRLRNSTPVGVNPTRMSIGRLVLVFTSIVEAVPPEMLATKVVLPSGVIASPPGPTPTLMSVGRLVLTLHTNRRHRVTTPARDEVRRRSPASI
jgi:hypothetical protein